MRDFDVDAEQAMTMLWEVAPTVAEQVEDGTYALHVIEAGRFGVSERAEASYRVIVDVREYTVEQDGVLL